MESRRQKRKQGADFVIQGSILAAASILVRIIGIAYRIPLINIIGDEGMGYYGTAFNVYNIALLLSSYSLPLAVSKLVASRLARGQYRNAARIFHVALGYATIAGGITAAVIWFGADFFAGEVFFMPYAAFALKTLAPTVWIMAYLGVFRGYFQGRGTMVPTAMSQVFEQIINAVVSVAAGSILFQEAWKLEVLKDQTGTGYSNAWGAAGGTIGTGSGALGALLLLMLLFLICRPMIRRQRRRDRDSRPESRGRISKALLMTVVPVVLSSAVYNLNTVVDNGVLAANFNTLGRGDEFAGLWGVYTGKYHLLINVPMAVSSALASSLIPSVTAAVAERNRKLVRERVSSAIRFSMMIAIPSAVGLTVLAGPINNLLFSGDNELAVRMTLYGSLAVVFYSLSTVTNGILQGIDRMRAPVFHALISLAVHLVFLEIMVLVLHLGIFSMVFANIVFAVSMTFLNHRTICRTLRYRQELKKTFLIPMISSAVMGAAAFFVCRLLSQTGHETAALGGSILAAVLIYGILYLRLGGLSAAELKSMPGGKKLYRIASALRLI